MKLKDMKAAERIALGTLVRKMVGIDGEYSAGEAKKLERVATGLGTDDFWHLIRDAGKKDLSDQALKERAKAIDREEVQRTIYSALYGIATVGSIVASEGSLLDWLAETWGLENPPG